jgi:hypothetical protein
MTFPINHPLHTVWVATRAAGSTVQHQQEVCTSCTPMPWWAAMLLVIGIPLLVLGAGLAGAWLDDRWSR